MLVIAAIITGARRSRLPLTINCSEKASLLALPQVDVVRDHHAAIAADDTDQSDEANPVRDRKLVALIQPRSLSHRGAAS